MKAKRVVIVLLSIALIGTWAVLATVAMINTEGRNRSLLVEHSFLESNYEKLMEKYENAKADRDEWEDKYLDQKAEYNLHLAYEWMFDMLANQGNANYDPNAALDEIIEREGLSTLTKSNIIETAQRILSNYGITIQKDD